MLQRSQLLESLFHANRNRLPIALSWESPFGFGICGRGCRNKIKSVDSEFSADLE